MRILCTADVHIGRRSTRLPPHLDGHSHSSAAAWTRVVDLAIAEAVDLVAVAGDLVDQANRYFEAIGTLESGAKRLAEAGIPIVVVAGNHDHDVLPVLVDSLPPGSIRLLGRGGRWERVTLERNGSRVHLDGWSFPHGHFLASPLEEYRPVHDGSPVLAIVHGDLEQAGSRYGPIAAPELRRHPDVFFLLGHVHTPRIAQEPGGARFLYPGSPQALDPGETGPHGVSLIEFSGSGVEAKQYALSSVRYDPLDLSVDGAEDAATVDTRVVSAVRDGLRSLTDGTDHLRCVRYRLRLRGRTRIRREIEARLAETVGDLELPDGQLSGSIESFLGEMEPERDLDGLAQGIGAPAILAAILRAGELDPKLGAELRRAVREVHGSRSFAEVSEPDELEALERAGIDEIRRAAMILLDELMVQKEVQ